MQDKLKRWMHDHVERLGGPTKALPELQRRLGLENAYTLYKMQKPNEGVKIPAEYLPVMADYFGDVPPGFEFWARSLPVENGLAMPVETTAPYRDSAPPAALRTAIMERSAEWPRARHRAFEVVDDSMVDAGIPPGATVVGVDFRDIEDAELPDGTVVVIERKRGGLVERRVAAVKKVVGSGFARIEFQPRSKNKAHKAAVLFAGKKADRDGFATQVLAVIYAVLSKPQVLP